LNLESIRRPAVEEHRKDIEDVGYPIVSDGRGSQSRNKRFFLETVEFFIDVENTTVMAIINTIEKTKVPGNSENLAKIVVQA
jgi:hypothetical protein